MYLLSPLTLLLAVTATFAYTCPPTGTFYHADATTNCRVYHLCENSVMTTFQCPDGEIFDHHTMVCADPSTTHCAEMHHMHKRSTDDEKEEMVHTIAIDELKQGLRIFYETVKESAKDTLKEVAPTVYERMSEEYGKTTKVIKEDVLPIVRERVLPRLKKAYEYSKNMGAKVFKKVYKSYQLSNETHISVVSFKDIIEELSNDIKPVINLGRYLSSRLATNTNTRTKRNAPDQGGVVSDVMTDLMSPAFRYVAGTIGGMVTGTEDSISSKILVPMLSEMFQDPETAFDLRRIFWSTKAAFAPLVDDLLKMQNYQTPEGTVISIPTQGIKDAFYKFFFETKPIIFKVFVRHYDMITKRVFDNRPLIEKSLSRFRASAGSRAGVLLDSFTRFLYKHAPLVASSIDGDGHINSYTLTEIQNDFRPIKITFLQMLLDYFTSTPGSFLHAAFNRNSEFYRSFLGKEVYATPDAEFYKSQKGLSAKYRSIKKHQ